MFRLWLVGVAGVLLAQVPDAAGDRAITTLIGSGITGGTLLAYAWWRQRHGDELLKQRDETIVKLTQLLIDQQDSTTQLMVDKVVPALERTASASNEMRAALERVIDTQRRGGYDDDRRGYGR